MTEHNFTDTHISSLKINTLSREKLNSLRNEGLISEDEWYITNDGYKDNAGGLDILDIGQSFYIDEAEGLRRWLNGQWIDINDHTRPFYERLMKAAARNPEILCTSTEYTNTLYSSPFNQCGKFVVDMKTGKIRLPKIVYAEGPLNISNIGNINTQRILVAKKEPTDADPRGYNWYSDGWVEQYGRFGATGSDTNTVVYFPIQFKNTLFDVQVNMQYAGSAAASWQYLNARNVTVTKFETVCQASTYHTWRACGYSAKIPTSADINIKVDNTQYYYIQIATGLETVLNIEKTVQLNNPYTLGDSKYSPIILDNSSWMPAGAHLTRSAYPSYYNMLLDIYSGVTTKVGITVKAENDSTKNRLDHTINTTTETFTLPTLNGTENTPSVNLSECSIDFSTQVTASPTTLTAPYNGWFRIGCEYQAEKAVHLYNRNTDRNSAMSAGSSGEWIITEIWANKGDLVDINYSATTARFVNFKIATNPGYLYFYVGDTIQDANIINANKLCDVASTMMGEWDNPSANSRTYCRRFSDGWVEQGGIYYTGASLANQHITLVFPQEFKDTHFVFTATPLYPSGGTAAIGSENFNNRTTRSISYFIGSGGWCGFSWRASGYFR